MSLQELSSLISVTYNGIELFSPKIRPQYGTEMSDSGRTIKYQVMTILVVGFIPYLGTGDKDTVIQQSLSALNTPGGTFLYSENRSTIIQASPDNSGENNAAAMSNGNTYYDVAYGPVGAARIINNWPLSCEIEFSCTVRLSPQVSLPGVAPFIKAPYFDTENQVNYGQPPGESVAVPLGNDLVDNQITVQYHIDREGMHVRTISGQLVTGGKFGNWADLEHVYGPDTFRFSAMNANRFLGISFLRPPPYFQREEQNWVVGADMMTLTYTIVDKEVCWVPPTPCVDWDARVEVNDSDTFELGGYEKIVMVDFTLPPETAQIGGGTNSALAGTPQLAVNNNSQFVSAMVLQTLLTFVFSDPLAVVWVHTAQFVRASHKRNQWQFMFGCFVARSGAYSDGWGDNGLFAAPPNTTGKYSFPGPYGFSGLIGSGYDLGQNQNLGLFTDQGNYNPQTTTKSGKVASSELQINELNHMHNEVAHLINNNATALIANGTTSSSIVALYQGSPILVVCGYKSAIGPMTASGPGQGEMTAAGSGGGAKTQNPGNYPAPVVPQTYFNVVTSISDSASTSGATGSGTPPPQQVSGPMGAQGYTGINAQILEVKHHHAKPIPSKLAATALYVTFYHFVVMLDPSVSTQLNEAGTTIESILPAYIPATNITAQAPSNIGAAQNTNSSGSGGYIELGNPVVSA